MLPDPTTLTPAQYVTSAVVIYALIITVPGLVVLTIWSAVDTYLQHLRRTAQEREDFQARRAAAEAAAESEGHELDQRLRRLFRLR